ncbi:hypothetical protein Q4567_08215 [Aliiglaciecola sp. 2_MG-2023]|uniref:hypothetical protein n=1 Tax=unclassified Aliiglaciecola TaxID=2593648 RepID=UPI0026E3FA5F|nr:MULTISPECIES: hypothetical protein [unclassified Aliiglaciecola]MDO6710697.1 hypothetical protein [Aliiglaciecola sp. 2_MG-2023]MDO6751895.1 hypothetical protein [Aliiglaciecola sp. 1_MG-2023]
MTAHDLLLLIHILLFCYWLGGDIGVFYSSNIVVDSKASREARIVAGKIMVACDLVPKLCMTLMLTTGGLLTTFFGVEHPVWQMAAIILLGPFWLTLVLLQHYKHHASYINNLVKFDFIFRCALIVIGLISLCFAVINGKLNDNTWIAAKLSIFYLLVFCGLMIRLALKDFGPAYSKLIQGTHTAVEDRAMLKAMNKAKPWVYTIWAGLISAGAIGIAKPLFQ